MNFSCYLLLEKRLKLQETFEKIEGLCLSYVFSTTIFTSVLHQWRKNLVPGLDLFQNPSFVVITLSAALELSKP